MIAFLEMARSQTNYPSRANRQTHREFVARENHPSSGLAFERLAQDHDRNHAEK